MTDTVDQRIASARALLAEHHQPITMTPDELWHLLARYQRRVHELLELLDELWISSRAPAAERARRAAELLAEVPQSQRASNPEGDYASVLADLLANIGDDSAAAVRDWLRAARLETDSNDDGTEPYCQTCREWVGIFHGLGDGWHHFHGDPAAGGERTLYEADHEAVIAWTVPPGRGLSPAGVVTLRQALGDAIEYRTPGADCADCDTRTAGLCPDHAHDLARTDTYRVLGRVLGQDDL